MKACSGLVLGWLICAATIGQAAGDGIPFSEALDESSLTWTTEGNQSWEACVFEEAHRGDSVMAVGTQLEGQEAVLSTTVEGPALLSFWWRGLDLSLESNGIDVKLDPTANDTVSF